MSKRGVAADDNKCPVANDSSVRLASDLQTDAIRDNFPKGVARPALRALLAAGYSRLEELATISEQELGTLHGIGPKALNNLKKGLQARGLAFKIAFASGGKKKTT